MQILCATDFTPPARAAADVAAAMARKLRLPLRLLHCGEGWVVMGELPVAGPDDTLVRQQLADEAQRLRSTGIDVTTEFHRGSPSAEVEAAAAEHATKILVLGPVTESPTERFFLGSVADRAAGSVAAPTLIVRDAKPLLAWINDDAALRTLCGVDFTASADAAVAFVRELRSLGPVDLSAAYVSPRLDQPESEGLLPAWREGVEERLRDVLGDMPLKVEVRGGVHAPRALLELAEEQTADLLLVGSHQHGGLRRLLKGSFSHDLVIHAKRNVMCVPMAAAKVDRHPPAIRRVLVATDFSAGGEEAIRHAYSLLRGDGAVRLLHVCFAPTAGFDLAVATEAYLDPLATTAKAREEAEAKLQELRPRLLGTSGITTTSEVTAHHDIAAAIREAADRFGADVICLGGKGHSRAHVAFLGSTVQSVLARSSLPVFVVNPPRS